MTLPKLKLRVPDLDLMEGVVNMITDDAVLADGRRMVAIKTVVGWGFAGVLPTHIGTHVFGGQTSLTGK